ncbi:hypothetical protein ScPMuIL_012972 [Solemya velum]
MESISWDNDIMHTPPPLNPPWCVAATPREAASLAASAAGGDGRKPRLSIWPEWSDADVNAEKWDVAHKGKEKDKGKSPVASHLFEDPEGKVEMPQSLKIDHWKRPQDYITEKTPVVVQDPDGIGGFDLITCNEHLHKSETLRHCISSIYALWEMHSMKNVPSDQLEPNTPFEETSHAWRPWEHIYAINKVAKGPNVPAYNPYGKYCVKLYFMGCWRKVTIDDALPFDENNRLLLPATTSQQELWPMLLVKAVLKAASLDYAGGNQNSEFGDCNVVHCLTGWFPESIPLQYGHTQEIWDLVKGSLPEWKLPEQEWEKQAESPEQSRKEDTQGTDGLKDDKFDTPSKDGKGDKTDGRMAKDAQKDKGKDAKDKDKGKDKDKKDKVDKEKREKEKSSLDESPVPEKPEVVIFGTYWSTPKYPCKVSVLGENVTDASEKLRQNGLSHIYPHPVWITQTRSCPLEPPPPPEKIPAGSSYDLAGKNQLPSDEPIPEPEPPKPIQCLEITSPFVNYKVAPSQSRQTLLHLQNVNTQPAPPLVQSPPASARSLTNNSPQGSKPSTPMKPSTPNKDKGSKKVPANSKGKDPKEIANETSAKHDRKNNKNAGLGNQPGKQDRGKSAQHSDSRGSSQKEMEKDKVREKGLTSQAGSSIMSDGVLDHSSERGDDPLIERDIQVENLMPDISEKPKKIWMDFDQFCKCFKTLYIFHKPNTYICNKQQELKTAAPVPAPATAKSDSKKPATTGNAGMTGYDDRTPSYLFVDSLKPTDIVVCYSSLSRWYEPPPLIAEEKKSHTSVKGKEKTETDRDVTTVASGSMLEGSMCREQMVPVPVQAGTLVAEPYSWKSLVTGQPVLRIRTTCTRAAVLSLPAGRHVLKFMMSSPQAYHAHLCSSTPFQFGDEETVMPFLTKESCRFVENASQVINSIGRCITSFSDAELFRQMWEELVHYHCPYMRDKTASKQHHFQVFNEALYITLKKGLGEAITPEIAFAWRVFTFDATTRNILGLPTGSRPATGVASHHGSAKPVGNRGKREPEKVENIWANREPTTDEHVAAVKIQNAFRGFYVRKIRAGRTPGTEENLKVMENLQKTWSILDPNLEQHGHNLFTTIFQLDPDLLAKYPFYQDEWYKIFYDDYQGQFADQPPNNWFIVFREIFFVSEEMLAVPKLYVPVNTCLLRVVNNDNGEEIPRVFQKVAPYIYKRNKRGYTFVAEARTTDQSLMAGRWRMRMIGSLRSLPAPTRPEAKTELNSSFNVREIKDYFIPNDKNIIFRYAVKVTEDHLTSLQINTSKPDVYIKLSVLDQEEEILSTVGKGHAVLPAVIFVKDYVAEEEKERRPSSRGSNKGSKGASQASVSQMGKSKPPTSANLETGRTSRGSLHSDAVFDEPDEKDMKPHKYIIQAVVLRNSWPLSEASWSFVQSLKEAEKNDLKIANKDRPPSPVKSEKEKTSTSASSSQKGSKTGKGAKDKGGKEKDSKGSRPPSQQFDFTKPHWMLRFVSDALAADDVEVRKDTERADEIRALKKAWEDAEPGRAAKAMQSRLKYLNSHMIRTSPDDEEEQKEEDRLAEVEGGDMMPPFTPLSTLEQLDNEILTLEPPLPPTPKEVLQRVDTTPFIRKTTGVPRYLDEEETEKRLQEQKKQIEEYKAFRQQVEQWREKDKQLRNLTKQRQLDECEELQAKMDAAREAINKPREAYRQKYLQAEQKRLEELAAQEAAVKAEQDSKSPKRGKSAKKSPTPGKKKK